MTPVEASDRRRAFCARLKSERERRGTSIEAIAASTKIKGSLLDALERGDLSRWPKGIYCRAFFRDYVSAIGLPADPTVSEFLELFTDGAPSAGSAQAAVVAPADPAPTNLRLFLASSPAIAVVPPKSTHELRMRLAGAAADVAIVGAVSWAASRLLALDAAQVALALAAVWYFVATWQHRSPSLQLLAWLTSARASRPAAPQVQTFEPSTLPYNVQAPAVARPSLRGRLVDALGGRSIIREYVERLSESELTFKSQRRRDLASVRRQRAEAANRGTADELSVM
jgi:hypothetical protein